MLRINKHHSFNLKGSLRRHEQNLKAGECVRKKNSAGQRQIVGGNSLLNFVLVLTNALRLTFKRCPANALPYDRHQIRGHYKPVAAAIEVIFLSVPRLYSSSNRSQPRSPRPSPNRLQFLIRRDTGAFLVLFALVPLNYKYQDKFPNTHLDSNVLLLGQNKTVATKRLPNYPSKGKPRGATFQNKTNTRGSPNSPWGVAYLFPRCRVPRQKLTSNDDVAA